MKSLRLAVVGLAAVAMFGAMSAAGDDETLPDDPKLLKAMVRMLRSSHKSKDAEIAKAKEQLTDAEQRIGRPLLAQIEKMRVDNAGLKVQLADAKERIKKLEALCEKHSIEVLTPAEKELAKRADDTKFATLYAKYRKRYVIVNGVSYRVPKLEMVYCAPSALKVGYAFDFRGVVTQILGENDMVINRIETGPAGKGASMQPRDSSRSMWLHGHPTKGLADGQQVAGPKSGDEFAVAIIGTIRDSSSTLPLAVPLSVISAGMTKEQFAMMLKKGIDPEKDD